MKLRLAGRSGTRLRHSACETIGLVAPGADHNVIVNGSRRLNHRHVTVVSYDHGKR
ncbi:MULTISPECIES: hypothetical protein [unclassified Mesorhizobium]|uniref:hypothetical protein n=1 Tax=unclassified Mesorhizobium TaxID=325217 RepID=UPI0016774B37|nr:MULTISPECIES: hypothetical protein [unclassified Mesorhizobium]